ncbi:SEC12-like protein 2 isoform X2 [Corylus avellana]|uniref:SEC12-like protein 2 isoform X2 n=1 Tax=Corylus avellana TaxID=13451 RepID=UPI00286CF1A7|nr:SEC12-like protein 2 isoform X2 [Corylus avellana]
MRKSKGPDSPNFQKYGVPFYSAAWVPYKSIKFDQEEDREQSTDEVSGGHESSPAPEPSAAQDYVVLAGGGGEGRSGIPNAVVLSRFDFASNVLSDQPVAKLGTGSDLPYRMAVHPGGDGLVCSFPKSCRWYEWDGEKSEEAHKLCLKLSDNVLTQLEGVGQQLALAFNNEGSALAAGGEDGNLRVFMWPSMEIVLNEANAHTTVKDLDFSPDGKYLVSLGNRGPARVWDMTSSTVVASLSKENDEVFSSCRFSESNDTNRVLYIAAVTGRGGSIVTWNTTTWKRMGSKPVVRDTISAFNISPDGKLLACGTTQGDILILNSTSMRVQTIVRKAHLGFVTALAFSHDSRGLASVSLDSSARVTLIEDKKNTGGLSLWVIVFFILLAIAVYFMKKEGILS